MSTQENTALDSKYYDTLIIGATVYEGTGKPGKIQNVGIINEKIAYIGDLGNNAGVIIDGQGMVLSPGFIDVHTHDDYEVFLNPDMDYKVMQGVTSVIIGNCGFSIAPFSTHKDYKLIGVNYDKMPKWENFKEYMNCVDTNPASLNVGVLAGHGTFRYYAMKNSNRKPTIDEMKVMSNLLAEGIEAGIIGMSSGIGYTPGIYSESEEMINLIKLMQNTGALYTTHMRSEGAELLKALKETIDVCVKSSVHTHISHFKALGRENWNKAAKGLRMLEEANSNGLDITIDRYPYDSGSTELGQIINTWKALSNDKDSMLNLKGSDLLIASADKHKSWVGKTVQDLAGLWNLTEEETTNQILRDEKPIAVILNVMDDKNLVTILKNKLTMIGSDGIPTLSGNPHPRLYGTFPRVIREYVIKKPILTMEDAINKMTYKSAKRFGLINRGIIKKGAYADLVLFDPDKIVDKSTFVNPRQYPDGISDVFVNGSRVVKNGIHTHARTGSVLRRG
ncbi:MAG TPA: D-aminoacylase [Victivallales bacterium]|nr:D-aminoacylase [Victivallales bacterium]